MRRGWWALGVGFGGLLTACTVIVESALDDKNTPLTVDSGTGTALGAPDAGDADDAGGGGPQDAGRDGSEGDSPDVDAEGDSPDADAEGDSPDADAEADADDEPTPDSGTATTEEREPVQILLGLSHGCALFPNGELTCWGNNDEGQREPLAGDYKAAACGDYHTCALTRQGALRCVGRNRDGQRASDAGPYVAVTAGDAHTCALDAQGKARCWGKNDHGQASPPDTVLTSIAAGIGFSCGIRARDQRVLCWGSDAAARTGAPAHLAFEAIDAGGYLSCGVTTAREVACWAGGTLQMPDVRKAVAVAAGGYQSCALLEGGQVRCWPSRDSSPADTLTDRYVSIAGGTDANCLVPAAGEPVCFGRWDATSHELPNGLLGDPL